MGLLDGLKLPRRSARCLAAVAVDCEPTDAARRTPGARATKQSTPQRRIVTSATVSTAAGARRKVVETLTCCAEQAERTTPHRGSTGRRTTTCGTGFGYCGTCHDRITGTVGEAIIVASATFQLDGRAYPDMSSRCTSVITERRTEAMNRSHYPSRR